MELNVEKTFLIAMIEHFGHGEIRVECDYNYQEEGQNPKHPPYPNEGIVEGKNH